MTNISKEYDLILDLKSAKSNTVIPKLEPGETLLNEGLTTSGSTLEYTLGITITKG